MFCYFGIALLFWDGKAMPNYYDFSGMVSMIFIGLLYIAPDTLPREAVIFSP